MREGIFREYREGAIERECVPYGLKLIFVELVNATANKLPYVYIVPYFGYINLALFAVADKLRERAGGILRSIRSLLYADFAQAQRKDIIKYIGRNMSRVGLIGLAFAFLFLAAVWFYIKYFLPAEFLVSLKYFMILSCAIPAITMSVVLHTFLESHLRYKELTVIGVIPNVIKILLILMCGFLGGIIGICVALSVSAWVTFLFYYILTVRYDDVYRIFIKSLLFVRLSNF
jgi:O-antigen/teichoic acid export membrane protein